LTKQFGGLIAVKDMHLDIQEKEIFGLIGPNGAGKTTIFNMITGIVQPTAGEVFFYDEQILGLKPHDIAQRGIARTFQNIKLFSNLTVFENVLTAAQVQSDYGLAEAFLHGRRCRAEEKRLAAISRQLLEEIGISRYEKVLACNLPYGIQRRLEIARALALKPKLLLLDEPAAGMNEEESYSLVDSIRRIRDDYQLSILVIDHHMDLIMNLCGRITVLDFGQLIAEGDPEQIRSDPAVIEAYLGVDEV